jgi:hypothetical protein
VVDAVNFALSYVGKRVLDATIGRFQKDVLRRRNIRISPKSSRLADDALARLLNEVANWSSHMEYRGHSNAPSFHKIYIELDCYLDPISSVDESQNRRQNLSSVLRRCERPIILLGRPGYGKTTTLKSICFDLITGSSPLPNAFPIPIVIRLREIDSSVSLFDIILSFLQIEFTTSKDELLKSSEIDHLIKVALVSKLINDHSLVIAIDGFDELPTADAIVHGRRISSKDRFLLDFRQLCLSNNSGYIFLTSRTADFPYEIEGVNKYEIGSLSAGQIKKFVTKYFRNPEQASEARGLIIEKKLLGSEFIPLTLTYICMVYARYGRLFNSRREMYGRIFDLLLDDWDVNRGIRRESSFSQFDSFDKRRFLKHLAYLLSVRYSSLSFFTFDQMHETYEEMFADYDGLARRDYRSVFREIETHTGIVLQSGSGYIFSHKTFQEYLFALYLIEYPEMPREAGFISRFPNEVALAVSFNENPSMYFSYLIMNRGDVIKNHHREFLVPFLDRLILEDAKFRVHPYLALGFLELYTQLMRIRGMGSSFDRAIKRFYRFLNCDRRLEASIELLAEYYGISEASGEKGYLVLRKKYGLEGARGLVDPLNGYKEPQTVFCPFELYGRFESLL